MRHNCSICGKEIVNKIKSAKYCSDECSKIGKKETQKLLMREKRKKEKEQKIEELEKSQANKIKNSAKPKKIRDIEKYYQKKKQELLENENQQWQKLAQKLNSENSLLLKQNTELLNWNSR